MAEGEDDDLATRGDPMDIDEIRARPMNLIIQCNGMKALGRAWRNTASAASATELSQFLSKNIDGITPPPLVLDIHASIQATCGTLDWACSIPWSSSPQSLTSPSP